MKLFLSARYSRRNELRRIRQLLHQQGHEVVSRWLDTEWEEKDESGSSAAPAEYRERHAVEDLDDVRMCDALVAFTEPPRSGSRGGRHVEYGAALALCKILFVVGYRENIFHSYPHVSYCRDLQDLLALLAQSSLSPRES